MEKLNFYFENTTLHGFSYISGGRHWIEKWGIFRQCIQMDIKVTAGYSFFAFFRIFWICAIITSSTCCLLLLTQLVQKIGKNPVIVYQPDTPIHIENVSLSEFLPNLSFKIIKNLFFRFHFQPFQFALTSSSRTAMEFLNHF